MQNLYEMYGLWPEVAIPVPFTTILPPKKVAKILQIILHFQKRDSLSTCIAHCKNVRDNQYV
jgi:hypothetical protein